MTFCHGLKLLAPDDRLRNAPTNRKEKGAIMAKTYARFEDLPVWQEAIRLVDGVYCMTEDKSWKGSFSLRDQIERAAL